MGNFKEFVFTLKNKFLRSDVFAEYKTVVKNQYLPEAELNELNWSRRKAIVSHAYENTVFYKKFYDEHNFHPDMLKTEADWDKVPVLEKDHIRKNREDMISKADDRKYLKKITTGGTTGQPLKVYHDRRFKQEILQWRLLKMWEIPLGADMAFVWRIPASQRSLKYRLMNYLMWWPTKRIKLDAADITGDDVKSFVKQFNSLKPPVIQGYVGAIEQLAIYIKKNDLKVFRPEVCWVTAAPFSELQRKVFEEVFTTNIINQYGSSEIFWVATNCRHNDNLHVNVDYRQVDIVGDDNKILPNGTVGSIVTTDLFNRVFPMIKYKVGDRAGKLDERCSCGCTLPLISPVKGRISDCVMLPDGAVISGEYLTTIFDEYYESIEKYQIHQKEDYNVEIKIIPSGKADNIEEIAQSVIEVVGKKSGSQIKIEYNIVDKIENDRGKIRFIISDIVKKNKN